jgi:hypothetical protein
MFIAELVLAVFTRACEADREYIPTKHVAKSWGTGGERCDAFLSPICIVDISMISRL